MDSLAFVAGAGHSVLRGTRTVISRQSSMFGVALSRQVSEYGFTEGDVCSCLENDGRVEWRIISDC